MSRLELTLWAATMLALGLSATAKAAPPYLPGPPLEQTYALSIELSKEAAAITYDIDQLLRGKDRKEVLEELRDLADELQDLYEAIEDANFKPRKWNRVHKRTDDVLEEVAELDEEIHKAVDHLNDRPRQTAIPPRGPAFYRSNARSGPGVNVAIRIDGRGRSRWQATEERANSLGQPQSVPYRAATPRYVPLRVGTELEQRVHRMLAIAQELDRLANFR
ncbi:hypothetical protein [Aeoliella sp.]|uniref:hypothetical protein n=1 Tax=Aeoliella sp. TaxID=2795800 RepID=UPI003CCBE38E